MLPRTSPPENLIVCLPILSERAVSEAYGDVTIKLRIIPFICINSYYKTDKKRLKDGQKSAASRPDSTGRLALK